MNSVAASLQRSSAPVDMSRVESLLHQVQENLSGVHRLLYWQYQASCSIVRENILSRPEHQAALRLEKHGHKAYSQNDEDGIIEEIFRRIGSANRMFLEFGVANGLENNTLNLLNQGWTGCWIEANPPDAEQIRWRFGAVISEKRLQFAQSLVDGSNINQLIEGFGLPREIDLLSIDIDGNDYHVWKAIDRVHPRVVVIEYNAKFRPSARWVMAYDPLHKWDGTDQYGASLESLTDLGQQKGYRLVGCSVVGGNAFFVRADAAGNHFQEPATAANFYQPARYFLTPSYASGHASGFGKGLPPDSVR